jgi:hypothetical protein
MYMMLSNGMMVIRAETERVFQERAGEARIHAGDHTALSTGTAS